MILKSETYHFHRLDLTRQAGFIVTIYDEEGLRLVSTSPPPTPAQAFAEAHKLVHNQIEGPTSKGQRDYRSKPCAALLKPTPGANWSPSTG